MGWGSWPFFSQKKSEGRIIARAVLYHNKSYPFRAQHNASARLKTNHKNRIKFLKNQRHKKGVRLERLLQ